jgi:hypothetical protein
MGPTRTAAAFGDYLSGLEDRLEQALGEIEYLKQRLSSLEPPERPLTLREICRTIPALKLGTVREWAFHRETNGLAAFGAVVKRGKRLFVYEKQFLEWLRTTDPANRRHVIR